MVWNEMCQPADKQKLTFKWFEWNCSKKFFMCNHLEMSACLHARFDEESNFVVFSWFSWALGTFVFIPFPTPVSFHTYHTSTYAYHQDTQGTRSLLGPPNLFFDISNTWYYLLLVIIFGYLSFTSCLTFSRHCNFFVDLCINDSDVLVGEKRRAIEVILLVW